MQQEAVEDRLQRLKAAARMAADEGERQRIRRAIDAHRAELARLESAAGNTVKTA